MLSPSSSSAHPTDLIARLRHDGWRARHLLWSLPSLLLIVMQVRPVLGRLDRTVLGTLDGSDALLQSGILTWATRHLLDPMAATNLPIFYPAPSALMSMDSLLGQALLVTPALWLGDPTPALLYNLAVIGTLLFSGLSGAALWLAVSEGQAPGRRAAGAGMAALLLLGAPFTAWQLGMLNQISPPWVALLLAALWRGWLRFREGQPAHRWWWLAAACLVFQAAWGWYGFADTVFVAGTCAVAGIWRAVARRRMGDLTRQLALPALVAVALVIVLALPYLQLRAQTPEYTRHLGPVAHYSTQLRMIGNQGPHRLALSDLDGSEEPAAARALRNTDAVLHPGWLTMVFAAVGLWRWRRLPPAWRTFGVLVTAVGVVGLVMSFGESGGLPPGSGRRVALPFGYLRDVVVPFQAYRAPVRFAYLGTIALTWFAVVGFDALLRPAAAKAGRWLAAVALVLIWIESVPMALLAVPVPVDGRAGRHPLPEAVGAGPVLSVPVPPTEADERAVDALWLHRALATGHPVTDGLSGWVPPVTRRLRARLAACEAGHADPVALLDSLRTEGVVGAEVVEAGHDPARVAFWKRTLEAQGLVGVPTAPGYRFYPLER